MDEEHFKEKELDIELEEKENEVKDRDAARDAQRAMAWFALLGMLLYPFAVVIASLFGLDKAADVLGSMAGTYLVSVSAIVVGFYGKEAYESRKDQ